MAKSLHRLDLLALLGDGEWGPLHVGMTRSEVEQLLGPPVATSACSPEAQRFATCSWDYGVVELIFDGNRLVRVQCERPELLDLEPPLGLGDAEVRVLHLLTLGGCEQLLDMAAIGYDVVEEADQGTMLLRTEAGGGLRFRDGYDPQGPALQASLEHR